MEVCFNGKVFKQLKYKDEKSFERDVVNNIVNIFGNNGIYFDIKKRIGKKGNNSAIPDGMYIDLRLHKSPCLYLIENEISEHDNLKHIGNQILSFSKIVKHDKDSIKENLFNEIKSNETYKSTLEKFCAQSEFNNYSELLDYIVFKKDIKAIVVIDNNNDDLQNILDEIKIDHEILEFKTYVNGKDKIHIYDCFQKDMNDSVSVSKALKRFNRDFDYDKWDTIVVPARREGFQKVFKGENAWYAIRMSAAMQDRIKYIAAYQVYPICAITHIAEVKSIKKYQNTDKYIVRFKGEAKEIKSIKLTKENPSIAPQAPRYTIFEKLMKAKTMDDVF